MNHADYEDRLAGYVLDELSEKEKNQIEQHLAECPACRQEAGRMRKVLQAADRLKAEPVDEQTCLQAQQRLSEAVEQLEGRRGSWAAALWNRPLVQYAAAAALMAGALLALHFIRPDQRLPDPGKLTTTTRRDLPADRTHEQAQALQKELALAAHYFEQNNVQGLAGLLQTGQEETKQAAANYLAQIGDSSVLDSLEILASQWEADPKDNPYQKAVDSIRKRQQK